MLCFWRFSIKPLVFHLNFRPSAYAIQHLSYKPYIVTLLTWTLTLAHSDHLIQYTFILVKRKDDGLIGRKQMTSSRRKVSTMFIIWSMVLTDDPPAPADVGLTYMTFMWFIMMEENRFYPCKWLDSDFGGNCSALGVGDVFSWSLGQEGDEVQYRHD